VLLRRGLDLGIGSGSGRTWTQNWIVVASHGTKAAMGCGAAFAAGGEGEGKWELRSWTRVDGEVEVEGVGDGESCVAGRLQVRRGPKVCMRSYLTGLSKLKPRAKDCWRGSVDW